MINDPKKAISFKPNLLKSLFISFILLLIIVIGVISYVLLGLAKPLLVNENNRLLDQIGNKVVSDLILKVSVAESMVQSLANLGEKLPNDPTLYLNTIPNIINLEGQETTIAGGGIWPEPFVFNEKERLRSFFWGRESDGNLKYYNDYNIPESKGYHNEEWYVPAKHLNNMPVFWSKSYMDPYSFQPMVTCTAPMIKNAEFIGTATIDLKLEGLKEFFEVQSNSTNSYIFALDRNNKFISYPNEELTVERDTLTTGNVLQEYIYASDLAEKEKSFESISSVLYDLNAEIVNTASKYKDFDSKLVEVIDTESYQINQHEARLIVSVMMDPFRPKVMKSNKLSSFYLNYDVIFHEPVVVSIFHMPKTYWKIVMVTPQRQVFSIANKITKKILLNLIITLSSLLIVAFFLFRYSFLIPLKTVTHKLKKISEDESQYLSQLEIMKKNEFGELAYYFNKRTEALKEAYHILEINEKKYRNIFENSFDAYIVINVSGHFLDCNQAALKLFNCESIDKLKEFTFNDLSPEFQPEGILSSKRISEMLEEVIVKGAIYFDWIHKNNEGVEFPTNVLLSKMMLEGKVYILSTIRDLTEKNKIEMQLLQAQKMETVGALAGGLAHDFNNLLGGIIGPLSLIKNKRKKNKSISKEELDMFYDLIDQSAQRAGNIVKQLLVLSRKHDTSFVTVDLNSSLKHIYKIASNSFDKSVILQFEYYPTPVYVNADSTQIEQVLLNLCINASHAMTEMRSEEERWGGTLSISISKIFADKFYQKSHPLANEGEYWIISIKDNGIGIPKNQISKIFTPFFTTKVSGKGTGLGLSMVYSIIKQHKGFIDVYSEVGIGTTFKIFLPVLTSDPYMENKRKDLEIIEQRNGLILIIDDEKIMRVTAESMLKEIGYEVILAENGEEGLELYKLHSKKIKVVLLDMAMPKLSGKDTFLELKKINKDVKVLLASGFKKDERVQEVIALGVNGFIQKPYTFEILGKAILDVLSE